MTWRGFAGFGAVGCGLVLACSGDWRAAGLAVVVALVPAVWWVCSELAATKALMQGDGRHRKRHGSLDAAVAALKAVARVTLP